MTDPKETKQEETEEEKNGIKTMINDEGTPAATTAPTTTSTLNNANNGNNSDKKQIVSESNTTDYDKNNPPKKSQTGRKANTKAGSTKVASNIDEHPYQRGSVIEVLYVPATAMGKTLASIQAANSSDPWYWSEDSSLCSTTSNSSGNEDEDDDVDKPKVIDDDKEDKAVASKDETLKDAKEISSDVVTPAKYKGDDYTNDNNNGNDGKINTQQKKFKSPSPDKEHHHHHHHHHHQNAASVRLCDIIDRVPDPKQTDVNGKQAWRYYVHYRDFNRRMDEWVAMDRIISPPSVGNAKARALKKEEEKLKRKQQRLEEKQNQKKEQRVMGDIDVTAPRASRRRSAVQQMPAGSAATPTASAAAAATPTNASETIDFASPVAGVNPAGPGTVAGGVDQSGGRSSRRRRSTAMDDDAATVVASNTPGGDDTNQTDTTPAVKDILTLPTAASSEIETTTVGEHVVATIPAQELDEHEGLDEASLREHEEITKIKNVSFIELGRHQMETWYFSPIPKELLSQRGYIEVLYICEFTFRMFARKSELKRFQQRSLKPQDRHPPGNEIYRKNNLSMFEVDGLTEKIYCQNLCYIAKLFLDHKTLYFDVDPFLFYVLCEVDDRGYHPVGYYSKEKYSDVGYNLACILTFPAHQRKGYGRFLIAFSYELSKKQEKVGGPERPVSDLGQKAYKPYWAATVIDFLRYCGNEKDSDGNLMSSSLSIMDISKKTSIMAEDIVFTLNQLGILKIINGIYFIAAEDSLLERLAKKYPVKEPRVDPTKLHWTPFLTDVKRDKFSIHSKKPNVDSSATVVTQKLTPPASQQQQQQGQPQAQQ